MRTHCRVFIIKQYIWSHFSLFNCHKMPSSRVEKLVGFYMFLHSNVSVDNYRKHRCLDA